MNKQIKKKILDHIVTLFKSVLKFLEVNKNLLLGAVFSLFLPLSQAQLSTPERQWDLWVYQPFSQALLLMAHAASKAARVTPLRVT